MKANIGVRSVTGGGRGRVAGDRAILALQRQVHVTSSELCAGASPTGLNAVPAMCGGFTGALERSASHACQAAHQEPCVVAPLSQSSSNRERYQFLRNRKSMGKNPAQQAVGLPFAVAGEVESRFPAFVAVSVHRCCGLHDRIAHVP